MKKISSFLIFLLVVLSLGVTAFAEAGKSAQGEEAILSAEAFLSAMKASPDTEKEVLFDLFGQTVSSRSTTSLSYLKTPIGEDGIRLPGP